VILSITSSLPKFKSLTFHRGLNILLADTTDVAATGNTRNSAGKTSFVQIVDFLLGASAGTDSLFRSAELVEIEFTAVFQVRGRQVTVTRSGTEHGRLYLGEEHGLPDDLVKTDNETERPYVSNSDWCRHLGHAWFGLPAEKKAEDFGRKNTPTFRPMMKYFLRLDSDGGFNHPQKNSESQQRSSYQVCLSYMFGLEWRIARELQDVRDREKTLETLRKAASTSTISEVVGTVAQLRPQLALAERKARAKREEINSFEVTETYRDTAEQASGLRVKLQDITRNLVSLKETLGFLQQALDAERPPYTVDVAAMYRASGVELPDVALRRFEDVEAFQRSVTANRRIHLQSEIEQAQREIRRSEYDLQEASRQRRELLTSLEGKGAFEDLVALQREAAALEAEHAVLRERFEAAEALERSKAELKVGRIEIQRRLQADYATHRSRLDDIIVRIAELIAELYTNREGYFEVSATDNGPEFSIRIEGDRGTGIRSMEIFCMDIVLYESVRNRFGGPGFLIHDSHLFDGVDARQICAALQIGRRSVGTGGQYIVTMNSDIYDTLPFPDDFDTTTIVLPTRLSDEKEDSGLFGFRFG
jgi:uncharacterized protein YydD (DUF2326 family)